VETMTGFINALALVFASGNIVWESIERLISPEELKSDKLLFVSFLGLIVNIGRPPHYVVIPKGNGVCNDKTFNVNIFYI
jgi:hypothetical protein